MDNLVEEYFNSVHWFTLVIYEPKFRAQLQSIADGFAYPSQKGFLLLLSVVLALGAQYGAYQKASSTQNFTTDCLSLMNTFFKNLESQLVYLMDQSSLPSVQACTLLGSYYVYHGKPKLSLALLGATIRMAQAIGLHREPGSESTEDYEERKRAWWTLYTWDR
jgi:hypothetical protein